MNKIGIYKITNIKTNTIYIGSSIDLNRRKSEHFSKLRRAVHNNVYMQNSFNKYGEHNFIFEILEYTTEDRLLELEQLYLDTNLLKNTKLFNLTNKADCNRNQPKGNNSPRSKTYKMINPAGKVITFIGLKTFCKDNKLDRRQIYRVISGEHYQHKGWRKYNKKEVNKPIKDDLFVQKERELLDPNNNLIKFSNLRKFCRDNNLYRARINKLLKKEIKQEHGWRLP